MNLRSIGLVLLGSLLADTAAPPPAILSLPLKGVLADCCNQAIEKALGGVKAIRSVTVKEAGERHVAEIILRDGEGLALSDFKKALAAANRSMGDSMGTKYEIAGELSSTAVHFYRTAEAPEEGTLRQALAGLKGYQGVWVKRSGFAVRFAQASAPSLDEVLKATPGKVVEVILAPSAEGQRHACPMHPEKVSTWSRGKCPTCGMALVEVLVQE